MIGVASASIASEAGGLGEKGATEGTEKATLKRTMAFFEARRRDLEACKVTLAEAKSTGTAQEIADATRLHAVALASGGCHECTYVRLGATELSLQAYSGHERYA